MKSAGTHVKYFPTSTYNPPTHPLTYNVIVFQGKPTAGFTEIYTTYSILKPTAFTLLYCICTSTYPEAYTAFTLLYMYIYISWSLTHSLYCIHLHILKPTAFTLLYTSTYPEVYRILLPHISCILFTPNILKSTAFSLPRISWSLPHSLYPEYPEVFRILFTPNILKSSTFSLPWISWNLPHSLHPEYPDIFRILFTPNILKSSAFSLPPNFLKSTAFSLPCISWSLLHSFYPTYPEVLPHLLYPTYPEGHLSRIFTWMFPDDAGRHAALRLALDDFPANNSNTVLGQPRGLTAQQPVAQRK